MENYLIDDYINSQKRNNGKNSTAESRRRRKAIDLFENKHIGIKEIALILEVSEQTVREYLGKKRLQKAEALLSQKGLDQETGIDANADESGQFVKVHAKKSKSKDDVGTKSVAEDKKLTPKRVDKIVKQRDELIQQLSEEGLSIAEVASKLNLTLDQAKERYSYLGLSIYTPKELAEMRAEDRAKQEEEKKRKEREKRRIRDRERREKQKEKQREEQGEQQEPKKDESSDNKEEITSFSDLKRKIFELTKEGKSRKAADLARQYIAYGKFLEPKEIKKLSDMADFIDLMHSGEKKHKGKIGGEDKKEDELDR